MEWYAVFDFLISLCLFDLVSLLMCYSSIPSQSRRYFHPIHRNSEITEALSHFRCTRRDHRRTDVWGTVGATASSPFPGMIGFRLSRAGLTILSRLRKDNVVWKPFLLETIETIEFVCKRSFCSHFNGIYLVQFRLMKSVMHTPWFPPTYAPLSLINHENVFISVFSEGGDRLYCFGLCGKYGEGIVSNGGNQGFALPTVRYLNQSLVALIEGGVPVIFWLSHWVGNFYIVC